jgi:hypothetical protein
LPEQRHRNLLQEELEVAQRRIAAAAAVGRLLLRALDRLGDSPADKGDFHDG